MQAIKQRRFTTPTIAVGVLLVAAVAFAVFYLNGSRDTPEQQCSGLRDPITDLYDTIGDQGTQLEQALIEYNIRDDPGTLNTQLHEIHRIDLTADGNSDAKAAAEEVHNEYKGMIQQLAYLAQNKPDELDDLVSGVKEPGDFARIDKVLLADWTNFEAKEGDMLSMYAEGGYCGSQKPPSAYMWSPYSAPSTASTMRTVADEEPSLAFILAVADTGDSTPSDSTVRTYQAALDAVDGMCKEDPNTTHADYALKAKELAAQEGVSVQALEVLQGMAISATEQREFGVDCADAYAVFVVLLTQGS